MTADPTPLPVAGVILSGGRGTRMFPSASGGDKALIELSGRPLAAHIADRLRPQVRQLALNANGDAARFEALQLPVIADARPGNLGPLAGILTAMLWAQTADPAVTHVATVPADTPFIPVTLVDVLWTSAKGSAAHIATASHRGRTHHAVALWPVSLSGSLSKALDDGVRAIAAFTDQHATTVAHFADAIVCGDAIDPFFNINAPDDLAKARQLLACL